AVEDAVLVPALHPIRGDLRWSVVAVQPPVSVQPLLGAVIENAVRETSVPRVGVAVTAALVHDLAQQRRRSSGCGVVSSPSHAVAILSARGAGSGLAPYAGDPVRRRPALTLGVAHAGACRCATSPHTRRDT